MRKIDKPRRSYVRISILIHTQRVGSMPQKQKKNPKEFNIILRYKKLINTNVI